jgi:hypothetical protein
LAHFTLQTIESTALLLQVTESTVDILILLVHTTEALLPFQVLHPPCQGVQRLELLRVIVLLLLDVEAQPVPRTGQGLLVRRQTNRKNDVPRLVPDLKTAAFPGRIRSEHNLARLIYDVEPLGLNDLGHNG